MNGRKAGTLSGMAQIENPEGDYRLVAEVIRAEAPRRGFTLDELAKTAKKDRTHISRMGNGAAVSQATLRAFEGPLGLPRDFLTDVARRDLAAIQSGDAEPDLVRWLARVIAASAPKSDSA